MVQSPTHCLLPKRLHCEKSIQPSPALIWTSYHSLSLGETQASDHRFIANIELEAVLHMFASLSKLCVQRSLQQLKFANVPYHSLSQLKIHCSARYTSYNWYAPLEPNLECPEQLFSSFSHNLWCAVYMRTLLALQDCRFCTRRCSCVANTCITSLICI